MRVSNLSNAGESGWIGTAGDTSRQDSLGASQAESTQRSRDRPATKNRGALDDSRLRWRFRLDSIMASSILPQFKQRTASTRSCVPWGSECCSATTHPLHRTQFIAASLRACLWDCQFRRPTRFVSTCDFRSNPRLVHLVEPMVLHAIDQRDDRKRGISSAKPPGLRDQEVDFIPDSNMATEFMKWASAHSRCHPPRRTSPGMNTPADASDSPCS